MKNDLDFIFSQSALQNGTILNLSVNDVDFITSPSFGKFRLWNPVSD
jgi:hypothetical protein